MVISITLLLKTKFVPEVREFRSDKILKDKFYKTDYLRYQPVARVRNIINKFADVLRTIRNRCEFKTEITRRLTIEYKDEEAL